MTISHSTASFRRVTPGILASAELARQPSEDTVSKAEAAITLKRAAPSLGISGASYHLLDILLGMSHADDWGRNRRPIVAISNALLGEYIGRSERTVTRAIRQLVEAGIIAYRDSPTGRRFVYRDGQGRPVQAYGLDFTPTKRRIAELKRIAEAHRDGLRAKQSARRSITSLSRAIADMVPQLARSEGEGVLVELDAAVSSSADIHALAAVVAALHDRVLARLTESDANPAPTVEAPEYSSRDNVEARSHDDGEAVRGSGASHASEWPAYPDLERHHQENVGERTIVSMSSAGDIPDGPIEYTSHLLKSKKYESNWSRWVRKASGGASPHREPVCIRDGSPSGTAGESVLSNVSIGLIGTACAELRGYVAGPLETWRDLVSVSELMCRMIGLDAGAWKTGCSLIGARASAAILASLVEKMCRDGSEVRNVNAYFRGMVERGVRGKLNLAQTFHGLAVSGMARVTAVTPSSRSQ